MMLELSAPHVSNKLPHIVTCQSGIDVSNYNHVITSLSTFFYCLSVASKVQCHRHQSTWLVQFPHSWLGVTNNSTIAQQTPTPGTSCTQHLCWQMTYHVLNHKMVVNCVKGSFLNLSDEPHPPNNFPLFK